MIRRDARTRQAIQHRICNEIRYVPYGPCIVRREQSAHASGTSSMRRGNLQHPVVQMEVLRIARGPNVVASRVREEVWEGAVAGGADVPSIALCAIDGNRLAVEWGIVRRARITRADTGGAGIGFRLPATTVEGEQSQRDHEENAQVHPARCDKRSHQLEQIVHFTFPPLWVVVRLDRENEPSWRRAARGGACRPRSRANSVPGTPAESARDAARGGIEEDTPDRRRKAASP
jgi:hypothetical protein